MLILKGTLQISTHEGYFPEGKIYMGRRRRIGKDLNHNDFFLSS